MDQPMPPHRSNYERRLEHHAASRPLIDEHGHGLPTRTHHRA
jgi:hypothetical protein